jgi:hypothetical protein
VLPFTYGTIRGCASLVGRSDGRRRLADFIGNDSGSFDRRWRCICVSTTGRAANGLTVASAEGHAPMVNWDVVSHDWDGMKQQLRDVAVDVEKGWKRITG